MNGRAADVGAWPVERGKLGPLLAVLVVVGMLPVLFDYVPDATPVFGLWAAVLYALGWWLCGFAPAATVSRCRTLFTAAFVARIVVVALLVHFDFWQDDEFLYHDRAPLMSFADFLKNPVALWDLGILRYSLVCQAIYGLLGYDTLGPRLFNAWMGSLIPVAVYLMAYRQEDRPWAVHAGWLVALFPDLVLYSGFEMKDIGVALGLTVVLFGLVQRAHGARSAIQAALILIGGFFACFLRFFLVAPIVLGLFWKQLERGRLARRALIAAGVVVLLDLVLLFVSPGASLLQHAVGTMGDLHTTMFSSGGSDERSFFSGFDAGYTPLSVAMGFSYIFLVPFIVWPFTLGEPIYKMLGPGVVVWYAAMPFVGRGAFHFKEKGASTVFAVVAAVLMGLTLGGGFHSTGRHRIMIMPILLLYAARGFDDFRRRDRWARRLAFGYVVGLALCLAYYCSVKGL